MATNAALIAVAVEATLTRSHLSRDEDKRALDGWKDVLWAKSRDKDPYRLVSSQRRSVVGKACVSLDGELHWGTRCLHAR